MRVPEDTVSNPSRFLMTSWNSLLFLRISFRKKLDASRLNSTLASFCLRHARCTSYPGRLQTAQPSPPQL
eukprot:3971873-Pyramimonas_sp.AAC.1